MKYRTNNFLNRTTTIVMQTLAFAAVACILSSTAFAATYYVSTSGNDNNPGTLTSPWKTITKANNTLKAGDNVLIRGGTYKYQQISPSNSGTSDGNRISYRNYESEQVTISDTKTGVLLKGRSYITVEGITFSNIDLYITMSYGSNHNTIAYCVFNKMRNYGGWRGVGIGPNASYNWIHHCTISHHGYYTSTDDKGDMIYIGDVNNPGGAEYNLIEDNTIYAGAHTLIALHDRYNVVRNNYMHHEEWYELNGKIYGNRCLYSNKYNSSFPAGWNLIEGNRFAFSGIPSDAVYADGIQLATPDNIIRNNSFYNNKGAGLKISTYGDGVDADDNYVYNNNFFRNGYDSGMSRVNYGVAYAAFTKDIKGTVLKNNIFLQNKNGAINFYTTSRSDQTVAGNWLSGDPLFTDVQSDLDPFDASLPDFSLQDGSPCIDAGTFLTETATSGSGTEMKVLDAHYFMDGWGIIEGDVIQLEGTSKTAQILHVDYGTNTITLDTALTWDANQGVGLEYNGSAPDMGAIEYGMADNSDGTSVVYLYPPINLRVIQ
jgi:hypothetical protein